MAAAAVESDEADEEEDELPLRAALLTAAFNFCMVACILAAVVNWAAVRELTGTDEADEEAEEGVLEDFLVWSEDGASKR